MKRNPKTHPKKKIECLLEWLKERKIEKKIKHDEE